MEAALITYIIIGETVAHGGQELAQPVLGDQSCVVLVEAAERVLDDLLGIGALEPLSEERQEHCEVDGTRRLVHHRLQGIVSGILAQGREHVVQIVLVHESVAVLVDHVEGLLELGDLGLVEHRKDVRGGALGTLLVGGTTSGGFAGRHCECCVAGCKQESNRSGS